MHSYRRSFGGYVGPVKVVELDDRGNRKVQYRGKVYSVSKDMARSIQQPLEYWIDEEVPYRLTGSRKNQKFKIKKIYWTMD